MGENGNGELGDGTTTDRHAPVPILSSGVQTVAAGQGHSLILKTDSSLWAVGYNGYGQLGKGTIFQRTSPILVLSGGIQAIAAGGNGQSLILKTDGSLWTAGSNGHGELGDGTTIERSSPVQILPGGVQSITAGYDFSFFVKTDGSLWAMGGNGTGQLGDGTTTDRWSPVQVLSSGVRTVAASWHSLIVKTDGSLWAAGANWSGQLGDGTTTDRWSPVQILSSGVQTVAAGGWGHSLILKTDGSLWAMGLNGNGELGDGTTTNRWSPVQILPGGVQAIAAGFSHSLILKTDGSLWAMGANGYGQLGDGTTTDRWSPLQILTGGVQAIAAGGLHSLILKTDGSLWTTGLNNAGQLGDGTTTDRSTPELVALNVKKIVAGAGYSMAVTSGDIGLHAPLIRDQPVNRTVNEGDTVTFGVTAISTLAPTYQWYFHSQALAGATDPTLTIGNVQPAAAGTYTVVVSNAFGSVTTDPVTLSVVARPQAAITLDLPDPLRVRLGYPTPVVAAVAVQPGCAYAWSILDGNPTAAEFTTATNLREVHVLAGRAVGTLTLQCVVTNSLGFADTQIVRIEVSPVTATGGLGTGRAGPTATLLPNGKVLLAGGTNTGSVSLASAELYDPATGTCSPTGSMGVARVSHTATLLANGTVLIAGGYDMLANTNSASAEVYDPATGTFSPTGNMGVARGLHTATLLPGGKVLIAAGSAVSYTTLDSAELYDPATGTFTPTGKMVTTRNSGMAVLLATGKVLIVGGGNWVSGILGDAELYDPTTGTFTATGSLATARINSTATLLPGGKVLVAGGEGQPPYYPALRSAELYDPTAGTFSPTGNLATARLGHTATLLSDGQVLLVAGVWNNGTWSTNVLLASVERYDPLTGTFTAAGSLATLRQSHTATLLGSGRVLIAGGMTAGSSTGLDSAELYVDPAESPLTAFTATPASITWGQSARLDFSFARGTGVLSPGVGAVTSGVPVTVSPQATTTYTLTVTYGFGDVATAPVTVTVVPIPPVITHGPLADQAVLAGATVTFTVVATGSPAPTYQWYMGSRGDTSAPVDGATSSSYTTPALSAWVRYWVRVTNLGGSVESDTALVEVTGATMTLADWAAQPGVPVDQHAPLDSPSGDGVTNLMKFALGVPPMESAAADLPQSIMISVPEGGTVLALEFTRNPLAQGIRLVLEAGDSPGNLTAVASTLEVLSDNSDGTQRVLFRETVPPTFASRRFARLRVELSP